jgi:hypothetical protein
MDSVYQAALNERKSLEKRIKEIDDFLDVYSRFANTVQQSAVEQKGNPGLVKATIKQTLSEATDILKDGKKWPTAKLLEEIRRRGFDIGGGTEKAKLLNLSNALSREGKKEGTFKADRAKGWSLKAPKSKSPVNVGASTGLSLRGSNNTLSAREPDPQG